MNQLDQLPIPLLQWYRENARVLPWRSDPTPYHVWVSEIMLQQTRVAAVLDYYRRFMEALPTVADLAAVEEDRLMKLWQGLGYYHRARTLHVGLARDQRHMVRQPQHAELTHLLHRYNAFARAALGEQCLHQCGFAGARTSGDQDGRAP